MGFFSHGNAQVAVEVEKQGLLLLVQVVDSVVFMKEPNQLQGRILPVKCFHSVIADVQDDAVMARILRCDGLCHVNKVGVHQNQVPGAGHIFPVIEKEKAFPFNDIKNFILVVEMLYAHVKFAVPDHLFQGNALNLSVKCNFFHMPVISSCSHVSIYSIVVINKGIHVNRGEQYSLKN